GAAGPAATRGLWGGGEVRSPWWMVLVASAQEDGSTGLLAPLLLPPPPPLLPSPTRTPPLSARTNAAQLGNRSSGSFARALATAGRSASGSIERSGGSVMCCSASWRMFFPLKGRLPVKSSTYTTARLYWSECLLILFWNVSGAA